ncbi:MAG TPA: hypothetical protein VMU16_06975 [Candidatus Binataceae bacterium]|nr:hypothetical protein [Candidatus Binataceae bacterium]
MTFYRRGNLSLAAVSAIAILIAGCASHDDQQTAQAQAAAAKADEAAAGAQEAAAKALAAANEALRAANESAAKVKEDTKEINRVADHLENMRKEQGAEDTKSTAPVDAKPGPAN